MGDQAGYSMVNGVGNITIGKSAAFTLADPGGVNGQPVSNTFVGDGVGGYVNSGFYTTAIGGNALKGKSDETDRFIKNTAIGYGAGSYLTGIATNNLYLGANAGPSSYTNESYKFYVSNGEVGDQPFMYGDMTNSSRTLDINASTTISGSLSVSTLTGIGNVTTYSTSVDSRIVTNLNSAAGAFASASAYSASAATSFSASLASQTALSASAFTSYAKLAGANTFTANQIVSGSITATGDVVAYSTSDKRHKNNIVNITDALAKVTKLNGVTWEWNDDVDTATKETPKTGLIAQEVQEVLPEVVKERGDGFLALDYSKTIGLLVEAIKEQQTQIHSLTLEIEKLKKNNSL
jgi:hypothetical protein